MLIKWGSNPLCAGNIDPSTQDNAEDEPVRERDDMPESMSQMSLTAQMDSDEAQGKTKAAAPANAARVKDIRLGLESVFIFWGCELTNNLIQALKNPQPDVDDVVPPKLRFMASCMAALVLTTSPSELFIPEYDTDMEGDWDSDSDSDTDSDQESKSD